MKALMKIFRMFSRTRLSCIGFFFILVLVFSYRGWMNWNWGDLTVMTLDCILVAISGLLLYWSIASLIWWYRNHPYFLHPVVSGDDDKAESYAYGVFKQKVNQFLDLCDEQEQIRKEISVKLNDLLSAPLSSSITQNIDDLESDLKVITADIKAARKKLESMLGRFRGNGVLNRYVTSVSDAISGQKKDREKNMLRRVN